MKPDVSPGIVATASAAVELGLCKLTARAEKLLKRLVLCWIDSEDHSLVTVVPLPAIPPSRIKTFNVVFEHSIWIIRCNITRDWNKSRIHSTFEAVAQVVKGALGYGMVVKMKLQANNVSWVCNNKRWAVIDSSFATDSYAMGCTTNNDRRSTGVKGAEVMTS
jgi:hypothetical protein